MPRHTSFLQIAAAFLVIGGGSAMAETAPQSGCAALASDIVSLTGPGAPATHSTGAVPLRAGDMLRLDMTSSPGETAEGSISLSDGGEAADRLLSGLPPQQMTYTVPIDGLYSFEYRAEGRAELTFQISCETQAALPAATSPGAYVERRAGRLLADDTAQTSLQRRAARPETIDKAVKSGAVLDDQGRPAHVTVSTSVQDIAAAEGRVFVDDKLDLWVEGRVSQSAQRKEEEGRKYDIETDSGLVYIGTDYLVQPGLMIGGLIQFDQYSEDYSALDAATAGHGVMFGPYASVRLAPDVFFDARAAWGPSSNETDIDGTHVSFDTDRKLFRGQLTGNRNLFGLKVSPSVALAMVEDRFAYPASLPAGSFADDTSLIGRLGLGSTVSYRVALDDGAYLQPNAALSTGWNIDRLDHLAISNSELSNEAGLKAEAGLMLGTADGVSFQATGALEGIGKEDYSAWSGRLTLTAPLN